MKRRVMRRSLSTGVATLLCTTIVVLAIAASTGRLDAPLGVGTHQWAESDLVRHQY